jgi:cycloeucalenol cycloisomerase
MEGSLNNAHWFSSNPGKAWSERWFLIYTPIWMAMMGLTMGLGLTETFSDLGYIILGFVVALPFVVVPALKSPENEENVWHKTYWFKANLYIFVFSIFGNYFGSEYFFDVLGMVYNYPGISWNLDAALLGTGEQQVPVLMYLLTHAYFLTYHTSAVVVLRRIRSTELRGMFIIFPIMVFAVGYFWAWMETRAMANPLIAESFYYEKMDIMLAYGSAVYAIYFVASFPIFYFLDEDKNRSWSVLQTIAASLSASMLTFYMLDIAAHLIGSL